MVIRMILLNQEVSMANRNNRGHDWRGIQNRNPGYQEPNSYAWRYDWGPRDDVYSRLPFSQQEVNNIQYGESGDQWAYHSGPNRPRNQSWTFGRENNPYRDTNMEQFGGHPNLVPTRVEGYQYGWSGPTYAPQAQYREFWNVPGPYTGVGPKNYQRSDEIIEDELCEIFWYNGQIDSSAIGIDVKNGEVTLTGTVDRRREKRLAGDIAESIPGVKHVNNEIHVNPNEGTRVRGAGYENVVMIGRIQPHMEVVDNQGYLLGWVDQTYNDHFSIHQSEGGGLDIPYDAIQRTNGLIVLKVNANRINRLGWQTF